MSRVMKQLNQSQFKGYETHSKPEKIAKVNTHKGSSIAMNLVLLLVPSLIVASVIAYQQVSLPMALPSVANEELQATSLSSKPAPETVVSTQLNSASALIPPPQFNVRSAPTLTQLKPLPRQDVYAHVITPKESDEQELRTSDNLTLVANADETQTILNSGATTSRQQKGQPEDNSDLLQGLDLTELSPELALKIESAMKDTGSDQRPDTLWDREREVVKLELSGHKFSGRLPSLNLQTHMYSSSEARRWVKVNGKEVGQGDWINEEVKVLEIKPQAIIVEFQRQKIEIPALYEWQG